MSPEVDTGTSTATEHEEVLKPEIVNQSGLEAQEQQPRTHEQLITELNEMQFLEHLRTGTEQVRLQVAGLELEKSKIDLDRAKVQALMMGMMQQM